MTKDVLKQRIKNKFGTLSNFARLGNFDRYRLQIVFARGTTPPEEELKAIQNAYVDLKPKETGDLIDPQKLETLKMWIDQMGGVYKFCQDNPDFKQAQVYALISGKRKRNSDLVKRLYEHFKL
jgi:hypothetical protein